MVLKKIDRVITVPHCVKHPAGNFCDGLRDPVHVTVIQAVIHDTPTQAHFPGQWISERKPIPMMPGKMATVNPWHAEFILGNVKYVASFLEGQMLYVLQILHCGNHRSGGGGVAVMVVVEKYELPCSCMKRPNHWSDYLIENPFVFITNDALKLVRMRRHKNTLTRVISHCTHRSGLDCLGK